jgi:integrase
LHDALYKSLNAWLEYLNTQADKNLALGIGEIPVYYNLNKGGNLTGKALNSGVIARITSEYGAAAGLAPGHGENQLSPHDLRRTCARNAYDNGASLLMVQSMLGHSDPKTTARYIGAYEQDDDTAVDHIRY